MLMSLSRSKNVCSLADSLFVPVFDPLKFVEVMEILLAEALCEITVDNYGHMFLERKWRCTKVFKCLFQG